MKSLVTGATGFIGSSIVRELLKDGIEVKAMVRETSDLQNLEGLDIEKAYGDIRDKDSVKSALKGCDTLYQAAALYADWVPDRKSFYDINIEGTRSCLGAALEEGIERVVYTSSVAAVGYVENDEPANEETEFNDIKGSPYVQSKYFGELEALKYYEKGLPVVVVNPAGVLGVRDIKPTPSGAIIVNLMNRKTPGYINSGVNLVDVEDVARGHVLAAQKGKMGERYILGNANMPMKEFFDLVAEIGGVESPRLKINYPIGISLAYLSEAISVIVKKPPMISLHNARFINKFYYFDSSKAVNELGMPQTPIRTTIEKAIDWFRENGYITQT